MIATNYTNNIISSTFATTASINYIVSAIDGDCVNFIKTAGITSDTIITALDVFYKGIKIDGLWDKIYDFLPLVGGTSATHQYYGKNPSRTPVSWVGSPTQNSTGIKGNGSTQYADLNWNPVTEGCSNTNFGIVAYRKGNDTGTVERTIIGQQNGGGYCTALETTQTTARDAGYIGQQGDSEPTPSGSPTPLLEDGVHIITSIGSNVTYYRNKVNLGTRTRSNTFLNGNMYALARNQNGSVARRTARTLSFIAFTKGLIETDAGLFADRITTLQTALGRA